MHGLKKNRNLILIALGVLLFLTIGFYDWLNKQPRTAIEEEGVLLIKSYPEYADFVQRYGEENVQILALERTHEGIVYIDHDEKEFETAFMPMIDSGFRATSGCILIMRAEDEGYVYQLDGDFNLVHRISLAEFEAGSAEIDAQTMSLFYSSLK